MGLLPQIAGTLRDGVDGSGEGPRSVDMQGCDSGTEPREHPGCGGDGEVWTASWCKMLASRESRKSARVGIRRFTSVEWGNCL